MNYLDCIIFILFAGAYNKLYDAINSDKNIIFYGLFHLMVDSKRSVFVVVHNSLYTTLPKWYKHSGCFFLQEAVVCLCFRLLLVKWRTVCFGRKPWFSYRISVWNGNFSTWIKKWELWFTLDGDAMFDAWSLFAVTSAHWWDNPQFYVQCHEQASLTSYKSIIWLSETLILWQDYTV